MALGDLAGSHGLELYGVLIGTAGEACELTDGNILLRGDGVLRSRRKDVDIGLRCLRPVDLVTA
jgi:hypothetical protein